MRITKTGISASAIGKQFVDAVKSAASATVEHWHEKFLPLHFEEEAYGRYNYKPRSGQDEPNLIYSDRGRAVRQGKHGRLINNPKYWWQHWRRVHHHRPLVMTGETETRAKRSIRINTRSVDGGATVRAEGVLDIPRYMYFVKPNQLDKADELYRTIAEEEAELLEVFNSHVGAALARQSAPATTQKIA